MSDGSLRRTIWISMITTLVTTSLAVAQLNETEESAARAVPVVCKDLTVLGDPDPAGGGRTAFQQDLWLRCGEILQDDSDQRQARALNQVSRAEIGVVGANTTKTTVGQQQNIQSRISALRAGATGFSLGGTALRLDDGDWEAADRVADLNRVRSGGGASADDTSTGEGESTSRWGLFLNGGYAWGDKEATELEPAYDIEGYDLTAGLDYRVSAHSFLGLAVGYRQSDSDLVDSVSELNIDGTAISVYGGSSLSENWFVDAAATFGRNDYDSRSQVIYTIQPRAGFPAEDPDSGLNTIEQIASGNTEGDEVFGTVGLSYDHYRGSFGFQPQLRIDYLDLDIDGYQESMIDTDGAGGLRPGAGLGLIVDAQSVESLRSILGADFLWTMSPSWGVVIPFIRADWVHEFKDDARQVITRYIHEAEVTGGKEAADLVVFTDEPDPDFFNLGVGLKTVFKGGTQAYLLYETPIDLDTVSYNIISAGLRFEF